MNSTSLKTSPRRRLILRVGERAEPIGERAASVARLLLEHRGGLTRLEMLTKAPPGLALGATGYIARLRKAGAPIESAPEIGTDAAGRPVRFVRYVVAGAMEIAHEAPTAPASKVRT